MRRTINWNKHEPNVTVQQQNKYLDLLINPSFQEVNRIVVLLVTNTDGKVKYTRCYLLLVEVKDYNIMIHGRNFFDQPVNNNLIKNNNIQKITTG